MTSAARRIHHKKIAIVLPLKESFSPHNAGAIALSVRDQSLSSVYCEKITVYSACEGPGFNGVNFTCIKLPWLQYQPKNRLYAKALVKQLIMDGADQVEVHNRVALFQFLKAKLPHCSVSLVLHNDPSAIRGLESPNKRQEILDVADGIICVSHYLKSAYSLGLVQGLDKIHVVPHGLNFEKLSKIHKQKTIIFVGRIVPGKGAEYFAEALVRVLPDFPQWKAVFAGASQFGQAQPGSQLERDVVATLKPLGDQVQYLNALPHGQIMQQFSQAEIAVNPSELPEGFGRVALEAMASQCALISTQCGGLADVTSQGVLILDVVNAKVIEQFLRQLIVDEDVRKQYQRSGFSFAQQNFDIENTVNVLDQIRG